MTQSTKEADRLQDEADEAEDEAKKAQKRADAESDPKRKEELQKVADKKKEKAESRQKEADKRKKSENKKGKADKKESVANKKQKTNNSNFNIDFFLVEPYKSYRYKVLFVPVWDKYKHDNNQKIDKKTELGSILDGNAILGFNSISDISNTTETESYSEGGENSYQNKFPKHTSAGEVTLSHGATNSPTIGLIRNMISGSISKYYHAQFSLLILMYNTKVPQVWVLKDVWPTEIKIAGFSTENSSVIVESLTVSVQRAELEIVMKSDDTNKNH